MYIDYLQALKNEIERFTTLGNNWDGYCGIALLESVAAKAKGFVSILDDSYIDRITDIFPNPHGTITIEWDNEKGEKLSLEIGENNYSYFIESNSGNPNFFNGQDVPTLELFVSHLCEIFRNELPRIAIF